MASYEHLVGTLLRRRYIQYIADESKQMEERKANWTEESVNILVDMITDAERWAIIRGKFGPSLTIQSKQKMWMEIAER